MRTTSKLCVLDDVPTGLGVKYARLSLGQAIAAEWPADASIPMADDRTGIKLGSLIGNTQSFLLLHRDVKDLIAAEHDRRGGNWPIEYLPFTLINHKGRAHSKDYFVVNPIGPRDCINHKLSKIEYFKGNKDKVVDIDRLVLDPEKLREAPPLFRVKQDPWKYVFDDALKKALERGFYQPDFRRDRVEVGSQSLKRRRP